MLTSSIGRKAIVAVTGLLLFGFVIGHLLGNLQAFAGAEQFNAYAHQLKSLGPLLWAARLGLLAILITHVALSIQLRQANVAARPEGYAYNATVQASTGSLTMIYTGLLVLLFIAYHLAHFTLHWTNPEFGRLETQVHGATAHNAFAMLVTGFKSPLVVVIYIAAQCLLGLHLSHGLSSLLQTLGINSPTLRPKLEAAGKVIATAILIGYVSIPVGVMVGLIKVTAS